MHYCAWRRMQLYEKHDVQCTTRRPPPPRFVLTLSDYALVSVGIRNSFKKKPPSLISYTRHWLPAILLVWAHLMSELFLPPPIAARIDHLSKWLSTMDARDRRRKSFELWDPSEAFKQAPVTLSPPHTNIHILIHWGGAGSEHDRTESLLRIDSNLN